MEYWNPATRGIRIYLYEIGKYYFLIMIFSKTSENPNYSYFLYIYIMFLAYFYLNKIQKIRNYFNQYSLVKKGNFNTSIKRINKLSKAMNIKNEIIILYDKSSHYSANAIRYKNNNYLIIPRNLTTLAILKPKYFDAIIAHELSHLKRKDVTLWLDNLRLTEFFALFFIYIFVMYITSNDIRYLFDLLIVLLIHFFLGRPTLKASRYNAEIIADLASVAYTESYNIINVLIDGYIKPYEDKFHPNLQDRINSISLFCEREIIVKMNIWQFMFRI